MQTPNNISVYVEAAYPAIDYYGRDKNFQAAWYRLYGRIFQRSLVEDINLWVKY
jgi:hypothetical protein